MVLYLSLENEVLFKGIAKERSPSKRRRRRFRRTGSLNSSRVSSLTTNSSASGQVSIRRAGCSGWSTLAGRFMERNCSGRLAIISTGSISSRGG